MELVLSFCFSTQKNPQQFTEIKGNFFFFLYAIKIALHCLILLQISNRKKPQAQQGLEQNLIKNFACFFY